MSEQNGGSTGLPRWARLALGALLAVAVVAALVLALRPGAVVVDVGEVREGDLEVTFREDGRTRLMNRFAMTAPVAGHLERVGQEAGDSVEAGDVLFRIRPQASPLLDERSRARAGAALEAARAGLERARAAEDAAEAALVGARDDLRRQEVLREEGGGSASAVERAEAAVRGARAEVRAASFGVRAAEQEVEDARLVLEYRDGGAAGEPLQVQAPVTGRILEVLRRSEGSVQPGTPVLVMGDPAELEVVVDLLSSDAVRVRPGAPALLERWGGAGDLEARVRRVEPAAFTRVSALGIEEQRVNVILDLEGDRAAWDALGDQYRVEARIRIEEARDVRVVPVSAIYRDGDVWYAFRLRNGRAERVEVVPGLRSDVEAEIREGLAAGDRVILYPGDAVSDGVRVRERGS
ncbi:MAG: HlyD family efflux transporter periplasmic adaptor subunit [Gemmatimonadales bacterium]|nr:MAG: HlyD family efflux transporter periplasmic adaptor subunit [Gemmatimonadales bacterium]